MSTQLADGSDMRTKGFEEARVAEEIVSVLPAGIAREFSTDRETLRYLVCGDGIKLRKITLRRSSLRRLASDPAREVKIEYLRRELLAAASQRREYDYPRPRLHAQTRGGKGASASLPRRVPPCDVALPRLGRPACGA